MIVAGDCLPNWAKADAYFNLKARVAMPLLGFVKRYNISQAWLKECKPPKEDLRAILGLTFAHVLPAHGVPVIGDAVSKFGPAIERAAASGPTS